MSLLYKTRGLLTRLVNHLHQSIFGRDMGPTMKDFLRHLSWSVLGILTSSILMFIVNILIGRSLGPNEYGKYNLVSTITNVLIVLMWLGVDTTLSKYVSESDDREEKNSLLSNALIILCTTSVVVGIIVLLLKQKIAGILETNSSLILLSLIFAIIAAFRYQLDNFFKARKKFQFQSTMRVLESVLILVSVILLVFVFKSQTYIYFILVLSATAFVIAFLFLLKVRKRLRGWNQETFNQTKKYLTFAFGGAMAYVVVGNIDKFFVSGFMGTQENWFEIKYF